MAIFRQHKETIAAIATPAGRGGIGIVRVSGPLSQQIAKNILHFSPKIRQAHHASFYDAENDVIDEGIALFFKAPHSFTGEDVLELQGHGGPVVLDRLLTCALHHGARLANPGEFSEQAFLNQKIDLVQAEAIADLIQASSEKAARSALRSLQGEFSKQINAMVTQLIQLRMYVEASIDFPDEDVAFIAEGHIIQQMDAIAKQLKNLIQQAQQGALIREGISLVIAGNPNVGKSSLLNFLSGRETAIVSNIAGTTRDVLREDIILDGLPLQIIDTAGLRETDDVIEQEGIKRARQAIKEADLVVYLLDIEEESNLIENVHRLSTTLPENLPRLILVNKIDLVDQAARITELAGMTILYISVKKHLGLDLLREQLKLKAGLQACAEGNFSARRRHLEALDEAMQALRRGIFHWQDYQASELLAEELRLTQEALNRITGAFTSDDLLGEIFSSFCIGK